MYSITPFALFELLLASPASLYSPNSTFTEENMESDLSLPTTLKYGAFPGVWLIYPMSLHLRKVIFHVLAAFNHQ